MESNLLKKSFWGYSKISVSEYIARINQEFSQKLRDTAVEHEREKEELQEKLAQLERENKELQNRQNKVAAILLDAKAFAAQLKDKAEAENRKPQAENTAGSTAEFNSKSIDIMRGEIRNMFEAMDKELAQNGERLSLLEKGVLGDDLRSTCESNSGKNTEVSDFAQMA